MSCFIASLSPFPSELQLSAPHVFSSTNGIIEASDSFFPTYLEHLALCLAHRHETKVGNFSVLRQLVFK